MGSIRPKPPEKLDGPTGLALVDRKLYVICMSGNNVTEIDLGTRYELATHYDSRLLIP